MDGLIAWLRRQIYSRYPMQEEYELRLETDDDAVRIVTVHKSKGLEFGVTFSPFARKEPRAAKKEPYIKFHDGDELVLDLAREQEHISHFEREQLAENVRQLYVALTRAKHRCYCAWQVRSSASLAALAWLL